MIDSKVFLVLFKRFKSFIPDYEALQTIFMTKRLPILV